jgi:sterol desaturase/sphingolipid hydroxylase (fatty acid hydroxylase superfamily)
MSKKNRTQKVVKKQKAVERSTFNILSPIFLYKHMSNEHILHIKMEATRNFLLKLAFLFFFLIATGLKPKSKYLFNFISSNFVVFPFQNFFLSFFCMFMLHTIFFYWKHVLIFYVYCFCCRYDDGIRSIL